MSKSGRRRCVFCGKSNVSREHAIPKWLTNLDIFEELRDGYKPFDRYQPTMELVSPGVALMQHRVTGTPRLDNLVVRIVCSECNGGWMSDLEKQCSPTLVGMIHGTNWSLHASVAKALYRWTVKTASMFEFVDRTTRTVTTRQLADCKEAKYPVQETKVFFAKRSEGTLFRAAHTKMVWVDKENIKNQLARGGATVFVFGELVITVLSASDEIYFDDLLRKYGREIEGQLELADNGQDLTVTYSVDEEYVDRILARPEMG